MIGIRENEAHRAALKRQRLTVTNRAADSSKKNAAEQYGAQYDEARQPPKAKRRLRNRAPIWPDTVTSLSANPSEET
jgi:hypothetical protein